MSATRVLIVDDEAGILNFLRAMLTARGYEVTGAATVAAAISEISTSKFDVLLSDLNIGQPGDGFTVVSAMKRTQPQAITLILTGYPDFETALNAIKSQVDDYLIKPPDTETLVTTIEALRNRQRNVLRPAGNRRVADIIEENVENIVQSWLAVLTEVPEIAKLELSEAERLDRLPEMLTRLAGFL